MAQAPTDEAPAAVQIYPRPGSNAMGGLIIGLVLGLAFAFVIESMDTSIGTIEDVEAYIGKPVLGVVPLIHVDEEKTKRFQQKVVADKADFNSRQAKLVAISDPKSPVTEAYRTLRTNILYLDQAKHSKVFVLTSSGPQEGKTTTIANLGITMAVMALAHRRGVTVEAELGCLGGIEDGHGAGLSLNEMNAHLTDPDQAKAFVKMLKYLDALAVAIGTSHGAYKGTRKDSRTGRILPPKLAMSRIHEIHKSLPNCHMVMHGSSSVPPELVDVINRYGGKMPDTAGVALSDIQDGIKHGVRKINVDTDSRLAMTGAARKVFAEHWRPVLAEIESKMQVPVAA